ncbi:MAG: hypothetical protein M1372_01815 [Patescibacteria group bacterium]|nr:hypothetical protein [Patescibacteria group bacterium]
MITIIHGDNIVESRRKIDEFLIDNVSVVKIDAAKKSLDEIIQALEFTDLFSNKRVVIIENLFSLKASNLEKAIEVVSKNAKVADLEIVIWQGGKIDARVLKKMNNAKVLSFDLPKYYFEFLDALEPEKGVKLRELFVKLLQQSTEEQIYYSIVKRIRTLLILKTGKEEEFEETSKMSAWQVGKLRHQAKIWQENQLISFYNKLFELEMGMKTSNLPLALNKHIDFLLLNL